MKKVCKFMGMLMLLYGLLNTSGIAAIRIQSIQPQSISAGKEVRITLQGIEPKAEAISVIADYGDGFKYALKVIKKNRNYISVRVPDLGKKLDIKLRVVQGKQTSNSQSIRLKPVIQSRRNPPVKQHRLLVGDKGEDVFKVENRKAQCDRSGEIFERASIRFIKKRFAEAQFVALPEPGCVQCKDIRVRWYNEPTGELAYQLQIFRRQVEGICRAQVR